MGFRFGKSFKLFPGARLNLSKSGLSLSLGVPGATLNLSSRGARGTVGLPGSGLSYSTGLPGTSTLRDPPTSDDGPSAWEPGRWGGAVQRFQSGPTAALTSSSLVDLRELMCAAHSQRDEAEAGLRDVERNVGSLRSEQQRKSFALWAWLFRRRLDELSIEVSEAEAELEEAKVWLTASGTLLDCAFEGNLLEANSLLVRELTGLLSCDSVWDVKASHRVDPRQRSAATNQLTRVKVEVDRQSTRWVVASEPSVRLTNANGDPLCFYPGFLLVDGGERAGPGLLSYADLRVSFSISRFVEEEQLPADAVVIDKVWAKVNKDGTRDRRFKGNYEIPVVAYGRIELTTASGLNEVYQVSNAVVGVKVALALVCMRLAMTDDRSYVKLLDDLERAVGAREPLVELIRLVERYS